MRPDDETAGEHVQRCFADLSFPRGTRFASHKTTIGRWPDVLRVHINLFIWTDEQEPDTAPPLVLRGGETERKLDRGAMGLDHGSLRRVGGVVILEGGSRSEGLELSRQDLDDLALAIYEATEIVEIVDISSAPLSPFSDTPGAPDENSLTVGDFVLKSGPELIFESFKASIERIGQYIRGGLRYTPFVKPPERSHADRDRASAAGAHPRIEQTERVSSVQSIYQGALLYAHRLSAVGGIYPQRTIDILSGRDEEMVQVVGKHLSPDLAHGWTRVYGPSARYSAGERIVPGLRHVPIANADGMLKQGLWSILRAPEPADQKAINRALDAVQRVMAPYDGDANAVGWFLRGYDFSPGPVIVPRIVPAMTPWIEVADDIAPCGRVKVALNIGSARGCRALWEVSAIHRRVVRGKLQPLEALGELAAVFEGDSVWRLVVSRIQR